ncbi:MAG: lactate dehydrogenase, partial [Methanoregula sp.]
MVRLAVVGVGRVGGEVAYLAAALGFVDELALYDRTSSLLRAQVLDIQHTGLPVDIMTDPGSVRDADICVFSAGLPRTPAIKT